MNYQEMIARAEELLAEGKVEEANELIAQAEAHKAKVDAETALKALKADADAKAKAEREAAEAAQQAELDAKVQAAVKDALKKADRPDYTGGGGDDALSESDEIGEKIARLQMVSRWDHYSLTDLATRFYVKSLAARQGNGRPPTQDMFNALTYRAHDFCRTIDKVPCIMPDGEIKSVERPAVDLSVLTPWDSEDDTTVYVPGYEEAQKVRDNVTRNGVKALMEMSATPEIKANEVVHSTQAGYGDEWVPTLMAATLWRTIRLEARVLGLFDQFDMPSNPYDMPVESTDPTVYGVSETTAENQLVIGANMPIGDSKIASAKITFSAGKIGAITFWSEEMNEDSIIPVEPQFRDQYGLAMAHGIDALLLHGDETTGTTNISYTGASIATNSSYLKVDGLRHEALVTTTTDSVDRGALTVDDFTATRKLMGTAGLFRADPSQLVILCDTATGLTIEGLSEVLTIDKYGPQATILRGMLGSIFGIPIVKSQDYGLTDANGMIHSTGGNNTVGQYIIVNRLGVKVGWKRRPRIIVGQVPFSDAYYILALARLDVGYKEAGMIGMGFNITV